MRCILEGPFVTFNARALSAIFMAVIVVNGHSWAASPEEAPAIVAPLRDASEYYPAASLRSGETGLVVLRFTVNAAGKAVEPFAMDGTSGSSSYRLIVAAEQYIRDSRFGTGTHYKKLLTASFVFELAPCGALKHSLDHDYAIDLCRDRPPAPSVLQP
jgi:hypothetical protein